MDKNTEFQLYQIAEEQAGYFALSQAKEIGLQRNQIYRELKRGKFQKAGWGVYRFRQFPSTKFEEIHKAVLNAGKKAVVGFQTALYIYELSDIIPDEIHLILPPNASRRREGIRIHTTQINEKDIRHFEGFAITTVARTIVDCAFSYVEDEQIRLAIFQSLRRGVIDKDVLIHESKKRSKRVQELIKRTIEEANL